MSIKHTILLAKKEVLNELSVLIMKADNEGHHINGKVYELIGVLLDKLEEKGATK